MTETSAGIVIRRGTPEDSRACHRLLHAAITEFERNHGTALEGAEADWWRGIEPYFRLLAADAAEWWVAQDGEDGPLIGHARSIEHDGLFQLTEFFVQPGHQARGLGRELLSRTFPERPGTTRSIIATRDVRALARYYGIGTVARFPILGLGGRPAPADPADLPVARRVEGDADVATVRELDRDVVGFRRSEAALRCLLDHREAWLFGPADRPPIGYAFVSPGGCGPIGVTDPAELPGILLHVETRAHELGMERFELEVPAPNEVATRHLLGRGFRFDPFIAFLMSDRPFGRFDRFVGFSPPLFL